MYYTYHHTVRHKTSINSKSHVADNMGWVTLPHSFKVMHISYTLNYQQMNYQRGYLMSRKIALFGYVLLETLEVKYINQVSNVST